MEPTTEEIARALKWADGLEAHFDGDSGIILAAAYRFKCKECDEMFEMFERGRVRGWHDKDWERVELNL